MTPLEQIKFIENYFTFVMSEIILDVTNGKIKPKWKGEQIKKHIVKSLKNRCRTVNKRYKDSQITRILPRDL